MPLLLGYTGNGSGRGNRTPDLQGMSLTSCHCSIPQSKVILGRKVVCRGTLCYLPSAEPTPRSTASFTHSGNSVCVSATPQKKQKPLHKNSDGKELHLRCLGVGQKCYCYTTVGGMCPRSPCGRSCTCTNLFLRQMPLLLGYTG